jgi:hypothetical protein
VNPRSVGVDLRNLLVVEATDPPRTKISPSGTPLREETEGVVKAAKKDPKNPKMLLVDFKTVTWMEPTSTCTSTGQIYKITSSGEVLYRQKCRNTGMAKRSFTPPRTTFVAKVAKGIRPNSFIRFAHEVGVPRGKAALGWPLEAYKTKNRKILTNVFGFAP